MKNAVRLFLSYRSANVRDRDKWAAILDEGFVFTLPITPYRSFHKGDIVSSSRVIVGIDGAVADTASLALMVESVGQGSEQWKEAIKRYRPHNTMPYSVLLLCCSFHIIW